MRPSFRLVIILALGLPALARCDMSDSREVAVSTSFDALARHTPMGPATTEPFFLNLKPGGDAARHWQVLRQRLESEPIGQQLLDDLLGQFKVEILNLHNVIAGPVAYLLGSLPFAAAGPGAQQ